MFLTIAALFIAVDAFPENNHDEDGHHQDHESMLLSTEESSGPHGKGGGSIPPPTHGSPGRPRLPHEGRFGNDEFDASTILTTDDMNAIVPPKMENW